MLFKKRMDDAMFKVVAESIFLKLETAELSDLQKKQQAQLGGAKLRYMDFYAGQTCPITIYPQTCQHYVQSVCTPPFAKAMQAIQNGIANILSCPRVDLIVQWVPEMSWDIKMHQTHAGCFT